MPANTLPIFVLTPKTQGTQFVNADGTSNKTLYTAGANGSVILGIVATTTDTAANNVELYVQVGGAGTAWPIGGKQVPAASGSLANPPTAAVNLLDGGQIPTLLPDGTLQLGAGDVVQASVLAAVTAAKALTIWVQAGDY